jgi:hypothetical protein
MPVIPALERQSRRMEREFQTSLGCIARLCLKKIKERKLKKKKKAL